MDNNLSNEVKRLKNLKNFKNKSDSDLEQLARKNIWIKQSAIVDKFKDNDEKVLAEEIFTSYLDNYIFENYNQITVLVMLVYEEILLKRVRDDINIISADENNKFISDKQIQSLHSIEDRVEQLKLKLGISKVDEKKDDLTALEEMIKKQKIYQAFNRNEFELMVPQVCKKCGTESVEMYLLERRCDKENFNLLKHPYFVGRWLFNVPIMDDYRDGKITKEQAAKYLYTSSKFIEWANDNRYKICSIEGVPQEQVDAFVQASPYLPNIEDSKNDKIKEVI